MYLPFYFLSQRTAAACQAGEHCGGLPWHIQPLGTVGTTGRRGRTVNLCSFHPAHSVFWQGKWQEVVACRVLLGTSEVLNRCETFL